MAVNDKVLEANNKKLNELLDPLNARQIQWLMRWWNFYPFNTEILKDTKIKMKEHFFSYSLVPFDKIKIRIQQAYQVLVDDSALEWIDKNNGRQLIYLINKMDQLLSQYPLLPQANVDFYTISPIWPLTYAEPFMPNLILRECNQPRLLINNIIPAQRYSNLIRAIDNWDVSAEDKNYYLQQLLMRWSVDSQITNKIKWLDVKNDQQLEWAWDYFCQRYPNLQSSHTICTRTDKVDNVLATFDMIIESNSAEGRLVIFNMGKAWSQKKFRDAGKLKKPYHLPLTKNSHKKLTELAQLLNKKEAQVLEDLIEAKHIEIITDEDGERRKY